LISWWGEQTKFTINVWATDFWIWKFYNLTPFLFSKRGWGGRAVYIKNTQPYNHLSVVDDAATHKDQGWQALRNSPISKETYHAQGRKWVREFAYTLMCVRCIYILTARIITKRGFGVWRSGATLRRTSCSLRKKQEEFTPLFQRSSLTPAFPSLNRNYQRWADCINRSRMEIKGVCLTRLGRDLTSISRQWKFPICMWPPKSVYNPNANKKLPETCVLVSGYKGGCHIYITLNGLKQSTATCFSLSLYTRSWTGDVSNGSLCFKRGQNIIRLVKSRFKIIDKYHVQYL